MPKIRIPQRLRSAIQRQKPPATREAAFLGNTAGVIVTSKANWVWVTDTNGNERKVFNDVLPANKLGWLMPVWIERIEQSQYWQIAGIHQLYDQPVAKGVLEHNSTHTAYGNDPVWVWGDQFMPWLCTPVNLALKVYRCGYYADGAWVNATIETLDLTTHKPASGARYVLVEVDDTGALLATNGSTVSSKDILVLADIPAPTDGNLPLCAVRMYAGQTVIQKNGTGKDILDLRFSRASGGGGGTGDMLKSTYDPQNISDDAFDLAVHTGVVSARKMEPLKVFPSSGLVVAVSDSPVYFNRFYEDPVSHFMHLASTTKDLTASVPGSGTLARWVLVYLLTPPDVNPSLATINGSTVANKAALTWSDIPGFGESNTSGTYPLAAVALETGQTVIAESDIVDLRFCGIDSGGMITRLTYSGNEATDNIVIWHQDNQLAISTKKVGDFPAKVSPSVVDDIVTFSSIAGAQQDSGTKLSQLLHADGSVNANYVPLTNTYTPTGSEPVGAIYWDSTLNNGSGGLVIVYPNGKKLNPDSELWIYGKNVSGSIIHDGDAVMITSAGGSWTALTLADATTASAYAFIGLATEQIAINGWGHVTIAGEVHDIDTSAYDEGKPVYLDPASPGHLTKTYPTAPNYVVNAGIVTYKHASHGIINVTALVQPRLMDLSDVSWTSSKTTPVDADTTLLYDSVATSVWKKLTWANIKATLKTYFDGLYLAFAIATDTNNNTGFVDRTKSTLTLSTRTLTIAPTVTSFDIYSAGTKITKTGGASCATTIPATVGLHYIYFDSSGTLQNSMTAWDIEGNGIPVCTIYWNGSAGAIGDERHNSRRNNAWHKWAHDTIGCRYESGLAMTYPSGAQPGRTQIETGNIHDEDIDITTGQQKVCRLWYETATGVYTWANGTDNGGYDRPYIWNAGTSRIQYPKSDAAYALTDVAANKYIVLWMYATTDKDRPIYIITKSATAPYDNLAAARLDTVPVTLNILAPEMKLIYRLIYAGDGTHQESADYRTSSTLPGGSVSSVAATQVTFAPAGGIAATNVQAAIEELDTEKANLASPALTGNPTAPTATAGDNDTSIATTAFVQVEATQRATPVGLMNGKLSVTVSSNNLTVAIKTLAGADPSASDSVRVQVDGAIRTITAALSVTKNAGTNWMDAGGTKFATKEIDYFAYIGYNATDGVVLGFSRIPYACQYSDFSATNTANTYCAISTITNAAAADPYVVVGRFAATLSATAAFNWSVPTYTPVNLIQYPIWETRQLTWVPAVSSLSGTITTVGTVTATYLLRQRQEFLTCSITITTNGTGAGALIATHPFTIPDQLIAAREYITGFLCYGATQSGNVYLRKYDETYPGANNAIIKFSGWLNLS